MAFSPKHRAYLVAQLGEEKVKELETRSKDLSDLLKGLGIEYKILGDDLKIPPRTRAVLVAKYGEAEIQRVEREIKASRTLETVKAAGIDLRDFLDFANDKDDSLSWISAEMGVQE